MALVRGRAGSVRDSGGGGVRSDPKRPPWDTRACACTPRTYTFTRHICTSSRDHMRRCESCGDVRCSSASDVQQALPGGRDAAQCRRARSHCASMTQRAARESVGAGRLGRCRRRSLPLPASASCGTIAVGSARCAASFSPCRSAFASAHDAAINDEAVSHQPVVGAAQR